MCACGVIIIDYDCMVVIHAVIDRWIDACTQIFFVCARVYTALVVVTLRQVSESSALPFPREGREGAAQGAGETEREGGLLEGGGGVRGEDEEEEDEGTRPGLS